MPLWVEIGPLGAYLGIKFFDIAYFFRQNICGHFNSWIRVRGHFSTFLMSVPHLSFKNPFMLYKPLNFVTFYTFLTQKIAHGNLTHANILRLWNSEFANISCTARDNIKKAKYLYFLIWVWFLFIVLCTFVAWAVLIFKI